MYKYHSILPCKYTLSCRNHSKAVVSTQLYSPHYLHNFNEQQYQITNRLTAEAFTVLHQLKSLQTMNRLVNNTSYYNNTPH